MELMYWDKMIIAIFVQNWLRGNLFSDGRVDGEDNIMVETPQFH